MENRVRRVLGVRISASCGAEVAWSGSGHASKTLAATEHLQSDCLTLAVYRRGIYPATFANFVFWESTSYLFKDLSVRNVNKYCTSKNTQVASCENTEKAERTFLFQTDMFLRSSLKYFNFVETESWKKDSVQFWNAIHGNPIWEIAFRNVDNARYSRWSSWKKFGGKINAPPSFLQRDVSDMRVINFGGSTRCVFAPCLFFSTLLKFTTRSKACAIMCECNAFAFRTGSSVLKALIWEWGLWDALFFSQYERAYRANVERTAFFSDCRFSHWKLVLKIWQYD